MKIFDTIGSVTNLKEELPTLMGFIPSKKFNRFDHSEQLLEVRKPTVACRLNVSMNSLLPTHPSRLSTNRSLTPIEEREILYD